MTVGRVARVLVDSPLPQLDRLFDYRIPDELAESAQPGVRVRVPLRTAGRVVDGYIVERDDAAQTDRPLSEVAEVVSAARVLPERLYRLVRTAADRSAGSASDILRVAIPKRMVRAEKTWLAAEPAPPPAVGPDALASAERILRQHPGLAALLRERRRGVLDAAPRLRRLPDGVDVGAWAMLLAASATVVLAAGRSAVLVAPDYRDQDQLLAALGALAPAGAVVRADSRQSGPDRYAAYLRMLGEAPCLVVGSRSAVYAPVHELGLVALWDDGDPLLAEPHAPGVHARDAALIRQELEPCALLLAGHTRTSDAQRLVEAGWAEDVAPSRRVAARVILSAVREGESRAARVPSAAYAAAREALDRGPVLVQVARPGYAPSLVCAQCRRPARCARCGGPLQARHRGAVPECAWCAHGARGWTCDGCGAQAVRMTSSGSERTAAELGRAFPDTRVIVADGDHPVTRVDDAPALVIATRGAEPVAAGGYRAVLLLDGDRMLQSSDLRIGESCLRWWSNAAALAAPGAPVHLTGVTGPVARALATWTQPAYAREQLTQRLPLRMPPTMRVASIEGTPGEVAAVLAALRELDPPLSSDAVLGPVETADATSCRALVRFAYGHGRAVAAALRAAVVAAAVRGRRRGPGSAAPRNTLRVRMDVLDPEL